MIQRELYLHISNKSSRAHFLEGWMIIKIKIIDLCTVLKLVLKDIWSHEISAWGQPLQRWCFEVDKFRDFDFLKIDASPVLKRYLLHKQPFYPFMLFQKFIQKIYPYSFYFLIFFGYWFNILVVVCIKKYSTFITAKKN